MPATQICASGFARSTPRKDGRSAKVGTAVMLHIWECGPKPPPSACTSGSLSAPGGGEGWGEVGALTSVARPTSPSPSLKRWVPSLSALQGGEGISRAPKDLLPDAAGAGGEIVEVRRGLKGRGAGVECNCQSR